MSRSHHWKTLPCAGGCLRTFRVIAAVQWVICASCRMTSVWERLGKRAKKERASA